LFLLLLSIAFIASPSAASIFPMCLTTV
jgi:hypothetical protein